MEEEFIPTENRGVLLGENPNGRDWMAGDNTQIVHEALVPEADWTPFLPTEEIQWGTGGDKLNCVTQSSHNVLEMQLIRLIKLNLLTGDCLRFLDERGYLDQNGKPNFNDRISAILNETTTNGNWVWKVANHHKNDGLFPESILSSDENLSWAEYYDKRNITQEILTLGQEFKKYFSIQYEWVQLTPESLMFQLQHAPIQIVFPNHAVASIKQTADVTRFFDTYNPFIKTISFKHLTSAMKLIIKQNYSMVTFVHKSGTQEYGFLETTPYTQIFHRAINIDDLKLQALKYNVNVQNADGGVNFGLAKEIVL